MEEERRAKVDRMCQYDIAAPFSQPGKGAMPRNDINGIAVGAIQGTKLNMSRWESLRVDGSMRGLWANGSGDFVSKTHRNPHVSLAEVSDTGLVSSRCRDIDICLNRSSCLGILAETCFSRRQGEFSTPHTNGINSKVVRCSRDLTKHQS